MKKDIHPEDYRTVVVQDTSNGYSFLTRSTAPTDETTKWEDGKEYPLITVEISSGSHPLYTGRDKTYEKEGRVERFRKKYDTKKKKKEEQPKEETE